MKFHVNLKFKDLLFILLIFLFFFLFKQNIFAYSSTPNPSFDGYITNLGESNFRYFYNDSTSLANGNIKYIHDYIISHYINGDSIEVNGNLMNFNYYVLGEITYCLSRSSTTNSDGGNCYDDGLHSPTNTIYYLFLFESKPDLSYYSYYNPNGDYHNYNRISFNSVYNNLCFTTLSRNDSTNDNINFSSLTCGSSIDLRYLDSNDVLVDRQLFYSLYSNGSISPFYYDIIGNRTYFYSSNRGYNNFWSLVDKNFDIPYTLSNVNGVKNYQPRLCSNEGYCNTDSSVQYYVDVGENVQSAFEMFDISPTLTFSNLNSFKNNLNNIYKYSVNLNYSLFDTSLYTYQYLLPNSSTWENITLNNYLLELYENGSYNFRIIENSTNEVISRNVLTIDDITDSSPFIYYTIEQIGSCLVPFNNSQLEICQRLTLSPSRYGSSYKFQYSLDNGTTWQDLYSDYSFLVEKNDIIPLRVLDSSNNLIWSDSLSFDYLDNIDSSLGITIAYNDTSNGLSENEEFFTQIYIYNLDFNYRNNVYISYDGGFNFELLSLERASSYYLGISKNYLSNIMLNIKILDSNDNVIFTSSHQVKINNKDNKDFLNYIESFNRSMTGPISSFITSPLRLVNMINNTSICEPLTFNINHIGDVSLPCLTNEIHSHMPDFLNLYQLLTTGLIGYYCGLTIIKTIKTLVRPDDDRIEVVNL